ncbi:hypothetical protein E1H13_05210 [Nodosilinea sp. P-1105]|nr:hypothetical protein [Nodosilinea sp. P-1105]
MYLAYPRTAISGDRLRLVADFLNFLVNTEHQAQPQVTESADFRPPSGDWLAGSRPRSFSKTLCLPL